MFGLKWWWPNVQRQTQVEGEICDRWHQMPERIIGAYWLLGVNHVRGRRILLVNELGSKVKENGPAIPAHLLKPKEVNGDSGYVQSSSVADAFSFVNFKLHCAFDRPSAYEYRR